MPPWNILMPPLPYLLAFTETFLKSISALSATEAWAVGEMNDKTLTIHWDGEKWSLVPSPNKTDGDLFENNSLSSVCVVKPDFVWACGSFETFTDPRTTTLIERWDGTKWSIVTSPNATDSSDSLNCISAAGTANAWAVGSSRDKTAVRTTTLTMRWGDHGWNIVPSPNVGEGHNQLYAVSVHSKNDVWAVGAYWNPLTGKAHALTMHWNGTKWEAHLPPTPGAARSSALMGVVNLGANGAWAVGGWDSRSGARRPLAVHWDGSKWTAVGTPSMSGTRPDFWSVSGHIPDDVWAVGGVVEKGLPRTLIEHWDGGEWKIIPNPDYVASSTDPWPDYMAGSQHFVSVSATATGVFAAGCVVGASGAIRPLIESNR